ncbi:MAG: type IX secretion system protein PorQ, partial [Bacteroidota bacterium]
MKRIFLLFLLTLFFTSFGLSQIGGRYTYQFVNLTNSARISSLGGKIVSLPDNDLNLVYFNPSLLNRNMSNQFVLNYVNYFSDINFGYVSYAKTIENVGNFSAGLHYINYGTFNETDNTGKILGNFNAAEYCMNISYSGMIDSLFVIGLSLKPIYSVLESYQSFGAAVDAGATYYAKNQLFTAALVVRNAGFQFKPYYPGNREPLPFEIIAGFTQKLKHAPFRLSLTLHNLQTYKLYFENENNPSYTVDPVSGDTTFVKSYVEFLDNAMRHAILGVEFLLTENFHIRAGYNY